MERKVISEKKFGPFLRRREKWKHHDEWTDMGIQYYTPAGDWVGNKREAMSLWRKRNITQFEKAHKNHCVCSIGLDEKKKIWYGWSHRAIVGFRIGDMIFKERFKGKTGKTLFRKHGTKKINTLADAKLAAKRFASYVS